MNQGEKQDKKSSKTTKPKRPTTITVDGVRRRLPKPLEANLLPIGAVPFQNIPLPFTIQNQRQHDLLSQFNATGEEIVIAPLKNPELPAMYDNVGHCGVKAKVAKIIELPTGEKNAFIICGERVVLDDCILAESGTNMAIYFSAPDKLMTSQREKFVVAMGLISEFYEEIKDFYQEMSAVHISPPAEMAENPLVYLNFIIATSPVTYQDKLDLLEERNLLDRAYLLLTQLKEVKRRLDLRKEIIDRTSQQMDQEQKEHFLRAQIRTIQNEIGDGENAEIDRLVERASKMDWPEDMNQVFAREVARLRRYNPTSPDYAVSFTYLETLLGLPWNKTKTGKIDIAKLEKDLDKDHYGMKKIKERIVEYLAVMKQKKDMRAPIICLYGPPRVGKTSLCKSVADSIGREYARISLGGLHDETQIRGHRRTYIGALPGRIIASLGKMESNNPVFVLDEIDKIGNDHHGDPQQALLEVLDPEQNNKFHDNYLDVDYDLSQVFFIATANSLSTISSPLLDRMELIEVSGYLIEEKLEIAKRHLIPKLLKSHGFKKNEIKFTDDGLIYLIENYTRESGVRKLEKTLASVLRKIALKKAKNEEFPKMINAEEVTNLLGKEEILPTLYEDDLPVGVAAGLAWTAAGGEILYFESSLSSGKGVLTLTGNLGDVMKESATLALQWLKANAASLGIEEERFGKTDVHLHVPEGAVPKDGPSAGITMVTSMASSFTGRRVTERLAMTGEITLRGKVLPVGGIKEKILAAKRAGITTVILSSKNRRDIESIDKAYTDGLEFRYVETVREVLDIAMES